MTGCMPGGEIIASLSPLLETRALGADFGVMGADPKLVRAEPEAVGAEFVYSISGLMGSRDVGVGTEDVGSAVMEVMEHGVAVLPVQPMDGNTQPQVLPFTMTQLASSGAMH